MTKPTSTRNRSYLFTITTTYNDVPYRQFPSLAAARRFQDSFGLNGELHASLDDLMGGGIGDVIGTKIFLFRDGQVVHCWSEDLDWAGETCSACPHG